MEKTTETGSVLVTVPAVAAWLKDLEGGSSSRALAYASSIAMEIRDGTELVASVSGAIAALNAATTLEAPTVPVGDGYSITVSIYNDAVSTTEPRLRGSASGIAVEYGKETRAKIVCLPVNAARLILDESAVHDLAPTGEAWYTLELVEGTTYYFLYDNLNFRLGLFDENGSFISSSYTEATVSSYITEYTATYTGTLIIAVAGKDNTATERGCLTATSDPARKAATDLSDFLVFEGIGVLTTGAGGNAITVTVPQSQVLGSAAASFRSNGRLVTVNGIEQESGVTANDFSAAVSYTVTAYDGTIAEYTVAIVKSTSIYTYTLLKGEAAITHYSGTDTALTIPATVDGYPVTAIANGAFSMKSALTSVVIPEGVISIGVEAFYSCTGLTSLSFPSTLLTIGDLAFYNCAGVTSLSLGDSITTIGSSAFRNCKLLTSVELPDSLTSLGAYAFADCLGLLSVSLSGTSAAIGDWAFMNCSAMTSLTIAEGIAAIGGGAFLRCSGVTSLDLPDSVVAIGNSAFSQCTSLQSVSLGSGVASLGDYAFEECVNLMTIAIPPNTPIAAIGNRAFYHCAKLESIELPDSVGSIGDFAFYSCSGLRSVNVPAGVKSIGQYAFNKCTSLASLSLAEGLESIGQYAFYQSGPIESVVIPGSVTSIGDVAFYGSSMKSLSFAGPGASLSQGISVFTNCVNLESVEVAADRVIQSWSPYAFSGCVKLASVTLADGLTSIGEQAFYNCSLLAEIDLPDSVVSIGDQAFTNCGMLASVKLPSGLTAIGSNVFYYCGLTAVAIPDSVTSIGPSAFYGCRQLASVSFGSGLEAIGANAFYQCDVLTELELPEGLTTIGEKAFFACLGLKKLVIPSTVTSLGTSAFLYCYKIETASVRALEPPTAAVDAVNFGGTVYTKQLKKLYVPKASVDLYKTAAGWSAHSALIVEPSGDLAIVID